jgi:hypothetical protein
MGMQVSCSVRTKVSQEEHIRMGTQRVRFDHARVGPTERSGGGGRARDEEQIRNYIREQEKEDKRLDQLKMFD